MRFPEKFYHYCILGESVGLMATPTDMYPGIDVSGGATQESDAVHSIDSRPQVMGYQHHGFYAP